jgi:CarD family transcriptional regulator
MSEKAVRSEFGVGDRVVYPAHGVGRVTGKETQLLAGYELKVYVIAFEKDKMTLRVPVNRAKTSGLRALSTGRNMDESLVTLKGRAKPGRGMWSRRAQEYETKINSGNVVSIAEVVRDLHKNVDDPDRSYSERMIYESALNRLAGEYAAINKMDLKESTEYLVAVLKSGRKKKVVELVSSNEEKTEKVVVKKKASPKAVAA